MLSQEAAEQAAAEAKESAAQQPGDPGRAHAAQQAEGVAALARQRAGRRWCQSIEARRAWGVAPIENEAVMHPVQGWAPPPAYKPTVLVHECGLIVSQVVEVSNESAAIPELLDQYAAVFGAAPSKLLLDAGHHNIDVLAQIAARQIDVLCPSGRPFGDQWKRKGNKGNFWQNRLCV